MEVIIRIQVSEGLLQAAADRGALMRALHRRTPTLAPELETDLRGRTPKRTGALREAASSRANRSAGPTLVTLYYDDEPQVVEWHRVYVAYQEGPPLGLATYTNGPRHMLYDTPEHDGERIETWAEDALREWADSLDPALVPVEGF